MLAPGASYTDEARGVTASGGDKIIEVLRGFLGGMSDAQASDAQYVDGGATVVAMSIARGTNDGTLGSDASRGRRVAIPLCEIFHFDTQGAVERVEAYYDTETLMRQLTAPRTWRAGTIKARAKAPTAKVPKARATSKR